MSITKIFVDAVPAITIIGGMVHVQDIDGHFVWPISRFTAFVHAGKAKLEDWQKAQSDSVVALPKRKRGSSRHAA